MTLHRFRLSVLAALVASVFLVGCPGPSESGSTSSSESSTSASPGGDAASSPKREGSGSR